MDRSKATEAVEMIKVLLEAIEITHCGVNAKCHSTLLRDVKPSSFRFVMDEAIKAIVWLDDALEDCEEAVEKSDELVGLWKKRCADHIHNIDELNERWRKHCENLFHEHRKSLAEKDREIYNLKHELWETQEKAEYWEDVAKKYKANNPCNFCGNCKSCQIDPNEGTAVCIHHRVSRYWIDPDDASCEYFKSNQVDRDKPDQPCCKACDREDCSGCTLCPF